MPDDPFTDDEYTRRVSALDAELEKAELDTFVAFTSSWFRMPGAVRYCCGYNPLFGSALFIFVRATQERHLVIDDFWDVIGRPEERNRSRESFHLAETKIIDERGDLGPFIRKLVPNRAKRVGLVNEHLMPAPVHEAFHAAIRDAEIIDASVCLDRVREVKSEEELDVLREMAALSDTATTAFFELTRAGAREIEVATEMRCQALKAGAEGFWTPMAYASGPRSAMYTAFAGNREMLDGDMVHTDVGVKKHGYHGDTQRAKVIGAARHPEKQRIIESLVEIQGRIIKELRPGIHAYEPYRRFIELTRELDVSAYLAHRFNQSIIGHGIGSDGHEAPIMGDGEETVLRENMVVTIEPMLFIDDVGGAGVEDMVVITGDGGVCLTTTPRIWTDESD
jgi:Xaa-Pro aminopeptidase/Xaa-Pro dipeptidase